MSVPKPGGETDSSKPDAVENSLKVITCVQCGVRHRDRGLWSKEQGCTSGFISCKRALVLSHPLLRLSRVHTGPARGSSANLSEARS